MGFRGGGGAGTGSADPKQKAKKEKKEKPPLKIAEGKAKDANVKLGDIKSLISKIEASESLPPGFKVYVFLVDLNFNLFHSLNSSAI